MVERNEVMQPEQGFVSIENLVQRLGVPAEKVGVVTDALYAALGAGGQPDQRVEAYLKFKLEQVRK